VPRLGLKRQEDPDPLVLGRVVQQQAAVLPDAVVPAEALAVALIHVDVVNPVAGQEAEDLVGDPGFGAPALPEGIHAGSRVRGGAAHEVVQLVGQVVVGPWRAGRLRLHLLPVEQVRADEVQRHPAGLVGQRGKTVGQAGQGLGYGMTEVLVGRIQQFRGLFLRQHIDRYPEVSLAAADTDLVMR
jgi:hypothetical protein